MFDLLEKEFKTKIPTLIRKVLQFFEYNCVIILARLDEASIGLIETNIRNDISADMLDPQEKLEDYLGRFSKCQQKFKFLDGQRKWLELIAEICRSFVGNIDSLSPTVPTKNVPATIENGNFVTRITIHKESFYIHFVQVNHRISQTTLKRASQFLPP